MKFAVARSTESGRRNLAFAQTADLQHQAVKAAHDADFNADDKQSDRDDQQCQQHNKYQAALKQAAVCFDVSGRSSTHRFVQGREQPKQLLLSVLRGLQHVLGGGHFFRIASKQATQFVPQNFAPFLWLIVAKGQANGELRCGGDLCIDPEKIQAIEVVVVAGKGVQPSQDRGVKFRLLVSRPTFALKDQLGEFALHADD